jgi:hypothetical protein
VRSAQHRHEFPGRDAWLRGHPPAGTGGLFALRAESPLAFAFALRFLRGLFAALFGL